VTPARAGVSFFQRIAGIVRFLRNSAPGCRTLHNESAGIGTRGGRRQFLSQSEREAPFMKGIILKAATVLLATMGYIAVGIALASAG